MHMKQMMLWGTFLLLFACRWMRINPGKANVLIIPSNQQIPPPTRKQKIKTRETKNNRKTTPKQKLILIILVNKSPGIQESLLSWQKRKNERKSIGMRLWLTAKLQNICLSGKPCSATSELCGLGHTTFPNFSSLIEL